MSLINDALKRAKQAQPANLAPADGPSLRPVERAPRAAKPDFLMLALIMVVLLLAGTLLIAWLRSGAIIVRARTIPAPVAAAVVPVQSTPAPAPAIAQSVAVAPASPAPVSQPAPAAVVVPEPVKPTAPAYKLQSVFYFPKNPSAVINGRTVHQGSVVNDARVVAISQESVTIVTPSGETKVLELPQ